MKEQENHPTPQNILQIGTAFWASKILLSAVRFQLFTILAERKSLSAHEIKSTLNLKCSNRNVFDFLDALVSLRLLNREGLLTTAKYSNSAESDFFLDKKKSSSIAGLLEMLNSRLYGFWENLEEALTTGKPQNEAKSGEELFDKMYSDADRLKEFVHAMSGSQMGGFMGFAKQFNFSKYKTLIDIGGSAGLLSIMVAKHHSHMNCITWDLPAIAPIANEAIQHFQLQNQIKTGTGDFFKDQFPNADIVVMGNILHDWSEQIKLMLMRKAYDALPSGGAYVVIENIIDDERRQNTFGLMMSLNMLIETGIGFDFTLADFKGWADDIGFKTTTILPLVGPASAVISIK
jgi:O-methyltransferase domain/Dimerisation domain